MPTVHPLVPRTAATPWRRLTAPLQAAVLAIVLAACAPAQSPVVETPSAGPAATEGAAGGPAAGGQDSASISADAQAPSADEAAPAPPPPSRATPADLQRLREQIPHAADWAEMDELLRELRAALRDTAEDFRYVELLQVEHGITEELARWVEGRAEHRELGQGEACLADVQCADGICTGRGCIPGEWTCTPRLQPDQRITMDMRTACLCRGTTFQGSSTVLRTHRVRSTGDPCPEEEELRGRRDFVR